MLRIELTGRASKGDVEGVKAMLLTSIEEAVREKSSPRVMAESRNDLGQSLLSIAAQHNHEELAVLLLTYVKNEEGASDYVDECDDTVLVRRKVFKASPNSRDLKGWNCVAVGVFHHSLAVLRLLLEHGGDPSVRSSYNKNAWDLARDELDAAGKVIKSNRDVRDVLLEFYSEGEGSKMKRAGVGGHVEQGLGDDGSPIAMQIEMSASASSNCLAGDVVSKKINKKKGANKLNGGSKAAAKKK
jgi:ankyrin repeat protein